MMNGEEYGVERPLVGTRWTWIAKNEWMHVVDVHWDGTYWWVQTVGPNGSHWSDVEIFWENVDGGSLPIPA